MLYFSDLSKKCDELNALGQAYLDSLPTIPNDEVVNRIMTRAHQIFEENNEDWDKIPEWVGFVLDGHVPYSLPPKDGSINALLGHSMVSQEAHLRNLLEIAEGRTTEELTFPVRAEIKEEPVRPKKKSGRS